LSARGPRHRAARLFAVLAFVLILVSTAAVLVPSVASTFSARPAGFGPHVQAPGTTTFLETFDGQPTNPEPWNNRDWDVFQTTRDQRAWANPEPVDAHHAFQNCGDVAAGGSHIIRTWPETVFKCNDHVMTSISGEPGYAAIYLSPPAMADFSGGSSTVSFDVSTFVASTRDWLDVLITPFADAMSYPFRSDLDVDGSGLPRNAIHIEQSFGSTQWEIEIIRDNVVQTVGTLTIPYAGFGGQSKVTRTPVRIVVGRTSLTMSYPTVPGASRTVSFPSLSWTQGIVQFGHHSYTPLKDCTNCAANTWHWDNIRISPARLFYQWQATPERTGAPIHDSNPRQLSFGKPAPSNAELVFSGNCGVQVRDTPTSAWRDTTIIGTGRAEHTRSYRVTVPAGSVGLSFRFVDNGGFGPGFGCQLSNPIIKAAGAPPTTGGDGGGVSPLLTWDRDSGNWAVRTMSGWTFTFRSGGVWTTGYDDVVVGDFDRDGAQDDYMLWDRNTGNWVIQSLANFTPQFRASGQWARAYDVIVVGDYDGDTFVNDLLLWDQGSGKWVINSMSGFRPTFRSSGTFSAAYDTMVVGDWDDDGRLDDAFLWDVTTGTWVVQSYAAFRPTYRGGDVWWAGYDRAYAGDWNNDTRFDDLLLWDDDSGRVVVFTWSGWKPLYRTAVNFSSTIDLATSADLDNNSRWNEMFVFDRDARAWLVYRWLAYVPYLARAGTWTVAYDVALA
jgi:hypothetical protein